MRRSPGDTRPEYRQLRIYAIDPMVSRAGEHEATVQIRFEDLILRRDDGSKSPVSFHGRRLEVVDVDASGSTPVWLTPVNLDDANIAMQLGLEPAESDPQFHQQMVYAVATRTLEQFDRALGRFTYFSGRRRLRLVPHAFRGTNAFYHPKLRAVLFGYFRASKDVPGENLPGQAIFTCLSHDIIAHEVTHAVRGIGFYDFDHGQTGRSLSCIELHPIVSIALTSAPTPTPPPAPTPPPVPTPPAG